MYFILPTLKFLQNVFLPLNSCAICPTMILSSQFFMHAFLMMETLWVRARTVSHAMSRLLNIFVNSISGLAKGGYGPLVNTGKLNAFKSYCTGFNTFSWLLVLFFLPRHLHKYSLTNKMNAALHFIEYIINRIYKNMISKHMTNPLSEFKLRSTSLSRKIWPPSLITIHYRKHQGWLLSIMSGSTLP